MAILKLFQMTATRVSDLQDALLKYSPNYVHFSGHGCTDGICLVNDYDETTIIQNESLKKLFKLFSEDIDCVFLNSCFSEEQQF